MWKWVRRFITVAFVLVALPCIAFTGLFFWGLSPMTTIGQGIGGLSNADQVAYIIFVDQMKTNEMLAKWREKGGHLSIAVDGMGADCESPKPALNDALSKASAFRNISLSPSDCSDEGNERDLLYVAADGMGLIQGGYMCGGLCGRGSRYLALRPFGFLMVIRTISFMN